MKRMFLLSILFACLSLPSQAQLAIDQTGIYRPQTSNSGFEPYRYTKYVDAYGNSTPQSGASVHHFKFSGSSLYFKTGQYTTEYRYSKTENNCEVYYSYCAACIQKWNYSDYMLVSQDRQTINHVNVDVNSSTVFVYKKGVARTQGMVE